MLIIGDMQGFSFRVFWACCFLCYSSNCFSEKAERIAVYDLSGWVSEAGKVEPNLFSFDASQGRPLTHFDLVKSLSKVLHSDEVSGVIFEVDQAQFSGLAPLLELSRLLADIRDAGKDVWVYTDALTLKTSLLGAGANHFVINSEGNISLKGVFAESLYFKGMLDKIGVGVDVVHIGEFKSAGEELYRTKPSPAAIEQKEKVITGIYQAIVERIAEGRGIKPELVQDFIDKGFVTAEEAKEAGLVDELMPRTDFISAARKYYGDEATFDNTYELPDTGTPEIKGFMDIMKLMFSSQGGRTGKAPYIAVVVLEDAITFESIKPVREEVIRAKGDEQCKGMVLRVNSPGGSALASEILWEATDEFALAGKPFVVSMGAVAASGGYYISAGAEQIFVEEGTITGSIGVVGMKLALGGAYEKLGITTYEIKRGAMADLFNSTRQFSPEERAIVRKAMLDVYATFKSRVKAGRGEKLEQKLESLAGGRVYTGKQAIEVGLADLVGGVYEAVIYLHEKLEEELPFYMFPEPKSPFEALFENKKEKETDEFISLGGVSQARMASASLNSLLNPFTESLAPQISRQIEQVFSLIQAMGEDNIFLLGPFSHGTKW